MKKCFTYLVVALLICTSAFGQTIKIQGVPRNVSSWTTKKSLTAVKCDLDFSSIKRWVGTGTNKSALIIKWDDKKDGNKALVWGYRWNTSDNPTGESMLRAVAAADPYFYVLVYGKTQYGAAIGGMGYDLNENGINYVLNGSTQYKIDNGAASTSEYNFDDFTSPDTLDHWQSGWYNGYWSYWLGDSIFSYSGVGASSRQLSDGSIDGWSFCTDMSDWNSVDMSGTLSYLPALPDYSNGTFVVNEGWYGHENASVNFLSNDGEWTYRVVQKENPGVQLGATDDYGTIYGDKFYLICKQEQDPGASVTGARITVCNAQTMKVLKQIPVIAKNADGTSACDGRSFLGVSDKKGYVGTSNGIYVMDLTSLEITDSIHGAGGAGSTDLYSAQIGNMVRVNDKVFAIHQKKGLLVIDAKTDTLMRTISGPVGWGYGSVVLSKDGNLWLSAADASGNGTAGNFIIRLNPATLDTTRINVPSGFYGPENSWYAWTADCFCASTQNNMLYWNGGDNSWVSNMAIYKYDIDKNEFSVFVDLSSEDWKIYGCSFRIDPVTDNAYVGLYKDFGDPTYLIRTYNNKGEKLKDYSMISTYWFTATPVFPDTKKPIVTTPDAVTHSGSDAFIISLDGLATDADNMTAAMVKTIESISDKTILSATMKDGDLNVSPIKNGMADVDIQVNSNGKLAETSVAITISGITGINGTSTAILRSAYAANGSLHVKNCNGFNFRVYNASGAQVSAFKANTDNYNEPLSLQPNTTYIVSGSNGKDKVSFKLLVR